MMIDFIPLERSFCKLQDSLEQMEFAESGKESFGGGGETWQELLCKQRVVILSEAGAGKTVEMRKAAKSLREEGKDAFFLRLEYLGDGLETAFEDASLEELHKWLAADAEGWFFLDSVDEARLRHPRDFETALRILKKNIAPALHRAHILLTSRASAWRHDSDSALCTQMLRPPEDDSSWRFEIVALKDLDEAQIRRFVNSRQLADPQTFLDAIDRADAWTYAARPLDLQGLIEFWQTHGTLGSPLELIENTLTCRLKEWDQDRAESLPLSEERLWQGVRRLAAAVTLAKTADIRVPDGMNTGIGLNAAVLLHDWNEREMAALLARPVFDEAIYGNIRFHHRSYREFLTAKWLLDLLHKGISRRRIEALLFQRRHGMDVTVPTMRPILPWLALWDDKIRNRLKNIAPQLLLESGDPSRLPLKERSESLRAICARIATGDHWSKPDANNIKRYAAEDLTDTIRQLLTEYAHNDDVLFLLLLMVWRGRMRGALPEAIQFASDPSTKKYHRVVAFKIVQEFGSTEKVEEIRKQFALEAASLDRTLLAELVKSSLPDAKTIPWLFTCLVKVTPYHRYKYDPLQQAFCSFVEKAELEILPDIVSRLDALLSGEPTEAAWNANISPHFVWLLEPCALVMKRLLEHRLSVCLDPDFLEVLHKLVAAENYHFEGVNLSKISLPEKIAIWPELKRALLWHEAEAAWRKEATKENPRDGYIPFLVAEQYFRSVDTGDFAYFLTQIKERPTLLDKTLALGMALRQYVADGCLHTQRMDLRKAIAASGEHAETLFRWLLRQVIRKRKDRSAEARRKSQALKRENNEKQERQKRRQELQESFASLRDSGHEPGVLTYGQLYLYEEVQDQTGHRARWGNADWRCLINDFGEVVAQAYRDGAVNFWRRFSPPLWSEGFPPNASSPAIRFGLGGLQIEAEEVPGWLEFLTTDEAERACRYALHEISGFPSWFPQLVSRHLSSVTRLMLRELEHELTRPQSHEDQYDHLIMQVSGDGQWFWDALALPLCAILKTSPPLKLRTLDQVLKILKESTVVQDEVIATLAASKSTLPLPIEEKARWFATWVGVSPEAALDGFKKYLAGLDAGNARTDAAMHFICALVPGGFRVDTLARKVFHQAEILKDLYVLLHAHIRLEDDILRESGKAYSPTLRDHAQESRDNILQLLRAIPGGKTFSTLVEIAESQPESRRRWILNMARERAEGDADIAPWTEQQVKDFHETLECTPTTPHALAELARLKLLDLQDELENGDSSIANKLRDWRETELRTYIGSELRKSAHGRYRIAQEEEFTDGKRTDLRFHGTACDAMVPVELKIADNWNGQQLCDSLEQQLCVGYMRDCRSLHGIFVVIYQGKDTRRTWDLPDVTAKTNFEDLPDALSTRWRQKLQSAFPDIEEVHIIGIDLTKRFNNGAKK